MSKQMKKMLISISIFLILIFGWYGTKKILFFWYMKHFETPAVTVSASPVVLKNWQSFVTSVGTITAVNGVDVSSEAPGIIKEIHFTSGQFVKQGDTLILLDASLEEAERKDNLAQLKLAELNHQRDQTLAKRNAISVSALDASESQLHQAQAKLEEIEARIKQKTITAPFSGKIGIRLVDMGQYISAGTPMVTLQTLNPLYVRFNLPEHYLLDLYVEQPVDITVNLAGGKLIRGKITAINAKVDQATRNILVEATIPNPNMQLYPGMYAEVKIWLRERKDVMTLPETAIAYSLYGDSVFIIKKEDRILHAYRQYIKVGERRDNEVEVMNDPHIKEKLKPGDQVVTAGQLKLQNGTPVIIDNSVEL